MRRALPLGSWHHSRYFALFCLLATTRAATDFGQCIQGVRNGTWGTDGVTDNHGNPISSVSQANAVSYGLCVRACGAGPEAFDWPAFYQQFSSWLLPYLALLSQLPFGAESRLSNLTSVLLTVGSPVLAAYSLALTVLNSRWVTRRFRGLTYPNAEHAAAILRNLQAAPICISYEDGLLPSLVVLHDNDEWWKELSAGLKHSDTWSAAAVASMGWVVIAYLLTIIDSFTGIPSGSEDSASSAFRVLQILDLFGKGIGFLWLWLVPVVYGWIQISPLCDASRLRRVFSRVDKHAYAATRDQSVPKPVNAISTSRGLTIRFHPEYASPMGPAHAALEDAELCAPIFNYARLFSWSAAAEEVASAFTWATARANARAPPARRTDATAKWEFAMGSDVDARNRTGSVEDVSWYCGTPPSPSGRTRSDMLSIYERMILASIAALSLQWGTTGAAILVVYFAPTVGLGCKSGAFALYAAVATFVWLLMVSSSFLAHHACPNAHRSDQPSDKVPTTSMFVAGTLAVVFRRLGKFVASLNAIWIVFANVAEFSNLFDNCWCNSNVLTLGPARAYNVIQATTADLGAMKAGWIGGVVLGTGSSVFFILCIHLLVDGKAGR
ncbi:hypothetical protein L226DRAFT_503087 [Lentinus tigrinus ALCF2SS1-7]|uniref:uncharacterized protein n=1 Tax=Lentinus tigrinus ALCF2SS1-7 TaxID=1328758 RepID=UPI00116613D4|nr:hypothetical protein L226DRAFT_503087 [Lentinus tigrinus ALCF2SS1-7]